MNSPQAKHNIDNCDPKTHIIIKGARVHNLKGVDVAIPRNQLVVITGLSGSGKSSLAFDTLFAEGQRMYVESLNSYARQFLGRMEKPAVDYIKGVSPAIAIEQKVNTKNPRSTVGTTTEIYDYLKLLFARIGRTISPVSGQEVRKDSVSHIVDFIAKNDGKKVLILAPLVHHEDRSLENECQLLIQKGYSRLKFQDEIIALEEFVEDPAHLQKLAKKPAEIAILIDRLVSKKDDEETQFRVGDSVQTAYFEGEGVCWIEIEGRKRDIFSNKFELDGMVFEEPSLNLFSFNNPYGACRNCEGYGKVLGLDPDLVFPDHDLSVYEGAIAPWRSERMSEWLSPLLRNGVQFDFPIHRPYKDLSVAEKKVLWTGNKYFAGLTHFFDHLEKETYKIQYRVMLSRYRGKTNCPECHGSRLRMDAGYVKIAGTSLVDLVLWPLSKTKDFFENLELNEHDQQVSRRILIEINNRLEYMDRVGLG